jgi:disulfide bond formation protein DsbB
VTSLDKAKGLALVVPASLLAGAYGSQYIGGLFPCEMCWWQRYAHFAALAFALLAYALARLPDRGRSFVWLAGLAVLLSGLIGLYHAGVEAKIFQGFTQCTTTVEAMSTDELMRKILAAPLVRCDQIQWSFLGISMAGWNFIVSTLSALAILWLSLRRPRSARA